MKVDLGELGSIPASATGLVTYPPLPPLNPARADMPWALHTPRDGSDYPASTLCAVVSASFPCVRWLCYQVLAALMNFSGRVC